MAGKLEATSRGSVTLNRLQHTQTRWSSSVSLCQPEVVLLWWRASWRQLAEAHATSTKCSIHKQDGQLSVSLCQDDIVLVWWQASWRQPAEGQSTSTNCSIHSNRSKWLLCFALCQDEVVLLWWQGSLRQLAEAHSTSTNCNIHIYKVVEFCFTRQCSVSW